jgi:hypothetical protein
MPCLTSWRLEVACGKRFPTHFWASLTLVLLSTITRAFLRRLLSLPPLRAGRARPLTLYTPRPCPPHPTRRSVPSPSAIFTDDYAELLQKSTFTCAPVEVGAAPYGLLDGTVVRNDVVVTVVLPSKDAPGAARLARKASAPGALIVFDLALLHEGADFAPGSACAAQLPFEAPTWAVASFSQTDAVLTLTLRPEAARNAFAYLDTTMAWSPDAGREMARRAAEKLPLGVDARRRRLGTSSQAITLSINHDGSKASSPALELLTSAGVLTCKNCFSQTAATYVFVAQFCIFHPNPSPSSAPLWLTSTDFSGLLNGGNGLGQQPAVPITPATSAVEVTAASVADCALASWVQKDAPNNPLAPKLTPGSAPANYLTVCTGGTGGSGAACITPPASVVNNAAFNFEAYVMGSSMPSSAGFSITSSGFVAGGATTGCAGATSSTLCTTSTQLWPAANGGAAPPLIPVQMAPGVVGSISVGLAGTAVFSGAFSGTIEVSTKVSVAPLAVKLGGKLAISDFYYLLKPCFDGLTSCATSLASAHTPYNSFPVSYQAAPFSVQFNAPSAFSIDVTLFSSTTLTIDSLPFVATSSVTTTVGAVSGTKSARQLRRYDGTARKMDSMDTCPTSASYVTVKQEAFQTKATVGSPAGPVTVATFAASLGLNLKGFCSDPAKCILAPSTNMPVSAAAISGAAQNLVAACVAGGALLTAMAGGPNAGPVTGQGGSTVVVVPTTPPSQALPSPLNNNGAFAGVVVGSAVVAMLLLYGVMVARSRKARPLAAAPTLPASSKERRAPPPASVSNAGSGGGGPSTQSLQQFALAPPPASVSNAGSGGGGPSTQSSQQLALSGGEMTTSPLIAHALSRSLSRHLSSAIETAFVNAHLETVSSPMRLPAPAPAYESAASPLPPGWVELKTADGHTCALRCCRRAPRGASRGVVPANPPHTPLSAPSPEDYDNVATKTTQWERPAAYFHTTAPKF